LFGLRALLGETTSDREGGGLTSGSHKSRREEKQTKKTGGEVKKEKRRSWSGNETKADLEIGGFMAQKQTQERKGKNRNKEGEGRVFRRPKSSREQGEKKEIGSRNSYDHRTETGAKKGKKKRSPG